MSEKPLVVMPVPGFEGCELEPVPIPADETPRAFLLRMTGNDYPSLEERTWDEIREAGMLGVMTRMVQLSTRPSITFRVKKANKNE